MSQSATVESILQTIEQSAKQTADALVLAAQKRQNDTLEKEEQFLKEQGIIKKLLRKYENLVEEINSKITKI